MLVHPVSPLRVLRGSRQEFLGWTPGSVKLRVPPRQSRGNSHFSSRCSVPRRRLSPGRPFGRGPRYRVAPCPESTWRVSPIWMMPPFLRSRSAGRRVALKFLPDELVSHPLALQRFEREAQTASSLKHAGAICQLLFTHTLWRLVSRCCEADFLSQFRRSLQVLQISDQDPVFVITKEKVSSVAARTCGGVALSWSSCGEVDVVPVEVVPLKMSDHLYQRLDALAVRDFVQ